MRAIEPIARITLAGYTRHLLLHVEFATGVGSLVAEPALSASLCRAAARFFGKPVDSPRRVVARLRIGVGHGGQFSARPLHNRARRLPPLVPRRGGFSSLFSGSGAGAAFRRSPRAPRSARRTSCPQPRRCAGCRSRSVSGTGQPTPAAASWSRQYGWPFFSRRSSSKVRSRIERRLTKAI